MLNICKIQCKVLCKAWRLASPPSAGPTSAANLSPLPANYREQVPKSRAKCTLEAIMAQICRTCVPKVPSLEPQGAPRRPPSCHLDVHWDLLTYENINKHIGISLFSQSHKYDLLDASGHYCCSLNPKKGTPCQPRGPPRSPKPPMLRQYVAHFSQLVSLRPQESSQDLPT